MAVQQPQAYAVQLVIIRSLLLHLKRLSISETVEQPILTQVAMLRVESWQSNLRRNTSLILVITILFFGIVASDGNI